MYHVECQYEGLYYVLDSEDGTRVASVGRFMPGPQVIYSGPKINPPGLARVVAEAMVSCADEIERNAETEKRKDEGEIDDYDPAIDPCSECEARPGEPCAVALALLHGFPDGVPDCPRDGAA